jgi:hypothetical protein
MRQSIDLSRLPATCFWLSSFLLLLGLATSAEAQINPFRSYKGPVLTQEDRKQANESVDRLLGKSPPAVGAFETWNGPTSGNSGTLTVERAFRRQGSDCRTVRSHVTYKAGNERIFTLDACLIAGKWKLL